MEKILSWKIRSGTVALFDEKWKSARDIPVRPASPPPRISGKLMKNSFLGLVPFPFII